MDKVQTSDSLATNSDKISNFNVSSTTKWIGAIDEELNQSNSLHL